MEGPYSRFRGKRSFSYHDREYEDYNGRQKRHMPGDSRAGGILPVPPPGLRPQAHGAKIMIADAAEGADDRVIFISSFDGDKRNGRSRDNGDAEKAGVEPEKKDKEEFLSPAQEALVGCLLGKGGRVIEQMREDTKTRIRILPRDQLPFCSLPFDEILQIVGDASAVKKAIRVVAQRLYENPAHEHIQFAALAPPRSAAGRPLSPEDMDVHSRNIMNVRRNVDVHHQRPFTSFADLETSNSSHSRDIQSGAHDISWTARGSKDELVFRLLCPNEKIGGIIGRGGNVIRGLQEDTGVRIKVLDPVTGSAERIIVISSVERPDDDISPAQEALLHLQSKIADLGPDEDAVITSRLLVPSDLVGCLLGKGGSVITEIRRSTRANIRILGKDDLPKCALPNDELVQIVGDIRVAREALIQVTGRLRRKSFEERYAASSGENINTSLTRPVVTRQNEFGSPSRLEFPRAGVDSLGPLSTSYQASTSPWMGQDALGGRTLRDSEPPGAQQGPNFRVTGALVTRTTMEVVIPAHAITAIIGDGGSRIVRIRQISGAKVDLLDVRSGASEGVVKISGTPEQTQAAQNLLQELILKGRLPHGYSGEFYPS
ncbi:hypothetical protein GOP47_0015403 [Adiantum capillus-veneris]|uniref:K Homology domain-containing protein n=1 Tax=Adiantum capillus-veneris TaxID=13818 RepID=A0A9D4UKC8_ADICA|nr:hypothetical protein GOP47_0015403 [Adiantum capillus-veneris]